MMLTAHRLAAILAAATALPFSAASAASSSSSSNGPDKDGKYWIRAEGIEAAFIPYGASISNLFVRDQYGIPRDLVAGFDNASYYGVDASHPHLGGVPGRYANRIKNSTFSLGDAAAAGGKTTTTTTYHVRPNENPTEAAPNGTNTLHGGPDGWDWRNFTVVAHTDSSITFSIVDPAGKEGFPGEVVSHVTYSLACDDDDGEEEEGSRRRRRRRPRWDIEMVALATTQRTPIMLSSHVYWNLDGFANNQTSTVMNHTLWLPYSGQRVDVDGALIPTGDMVANKRGGVNDFWSRPRQIGEGFEKDGIKGNCGSNCIGYDNCYIVNRDQLGPYDWRTQGPVARVSSPWSGIQLDIYTDQDAFQVYSCNGQDGTLALKKTQGLHGGGGGGGGHSKEAEEEAFPRTVPQYGCLVLEVQDWIDGINNPEWMRERKQVFGPGDGPYVLRARYEFSTKEREEKS